MKIKFLQSISPGIVATEIFTAEQLANITQQPHLKSEDVAAAVVYVLGTPPHVQVCKFEYVKNEI